MDQRIVNATDGTPLVLIPEGEFLAGGPGENEGGGQPFPVHMPAYYLALHPVTNVQYARFLNAVRPGEADLEKWILLNSLCFVRAKSGRYEAYDGKDDHPVVQASWYGAQAYAEWAGLRLPRELEWEKGARGTDGREYPWGESWKKSKCCNIKNRWGKQTCEVWRYAEGQSPWGLNQMSGNVWEWCEDWYDKESYGRYKGGNLTPPSNGSYRVLRGGSWLNYDVDFRCARRHGYKPEHRDHIYGFRCARNVF